MSLRSRESGVGSRESGKLWVVTRLERLLVRSGAGSTDFQPLVPHLDHIARFELAAAAGLDLAVHQYFSGLDHDLRLSARAHEARHLQRLAERRAFRNLQRAFSCGTGRASA